MAATFQFERDDGAATSSPPHGTTQGTVVTDTNWKNSDTAATAYSSAPITAGNNSYEIWNYGNFSGTYDQISSGLFAHTATALGTGLSLVGCPACTTTSGLTYTTPSTTANSNLTTSMTTAIAIASGVAVFFGATGPQAATMASSTTSNPAFTNYLTTQLQTTGSAAAGDTATITLTLQYNEN